MKKAFSYLEILITIGLITICFLIFYGWQQGYTKNIKVINQYYQDRTTLINQAEQGFGAEALLTNNIYLKTTSVNNLQLEYLVKY
jgi:hypothetical protein